MPFQLTRKFLNKTKSQESPKKKPKMLDSLRTSSRSLDIKKENFEGMGFLSYLTVVKIQYNLHLVTPNSVRNRD